MGMNESQSLGSGLGPGFRVLQMSSSAKARWDEANPSDPVSWYTLHPTELECIRSFWVAGPSSSQGRLGADGSLLVLSWLGREALHFLGVCFAAQRQDSPTQGRGGNSQSGHLSQGLVNVPVYQAAPGMSCCRGGGGRGRL